ncbi:gamma-glutamylcyclotransferase family protein [Tahibacter amnicola]|uniref:Putative gamma-glutamylcyclotransferase n=1 Tax=Tahibacter amnicola TaxID=2976241 RepID=A0ABY6BLB8_9GAMM|nr:gamma-glutamylcyclotransferase family protein [Tahibacter amnicola]UXI70228.1 gamma-glutamylcyclotransferase [Tahibacter amnicola]
MSHRLFVYGTLAPGRSNAHMLADVPGEWESATVTGVLYPEGWGAAAGYPALVPDKSGAPVAGFLFTSEALPGHWQRLDEFEGDGYQRVAVQARRANGEYVDAYVYALNRTSSEEPVPHTKAIAPPVQASSREFRAEPPRLATRHAKPPSKPVDTSRLVSALAIGARLVAVLMTLASAWLWTVAASAMASNDPYSRLFGLLVGVFAACTTFFALVAVASSGIPLLSRLAMAGIVVLMIGLVVMKFAALV